MSDSFLFFPFPLKCSQSCSLSGFVSTEPHYSSQHREPFPSAAAGLEIGSQLEISAWAGVGLSISPVPVWFCCPSACSKHPSQVGTEDFFFFNQNALRGSVWRGQILFGLILGVASQGGSCSECSSCTVPWFILNTKSAVMPEWLEIIPNCNVVFMVFVRESPEKHAGD